MPASVAAHHAPNDGDLLRMARRPVRPLSALRPPPSCMCSVCRPPCMCDDLSCAPELFRPCILGGKSLSFIWTRVCGVRACTSLLLTAKDNSFDRMISSNMHRIISKEFDMDIFFRKNHNTPATVKLFFSRCMTHPGGSSLWVEGCGCVHVHERECNCLITK